MTQTSESKDILEDWKNNRFVIADPDLVEGTDIVVVLTDVEYWSEHYEQLDEWCSKNNSKLEGMTVAIPLESVLTVFILRWS
jgi:predicted PilT family ATPase